MCPGRVDILAVSTAEYDLLFRLLLRSGCCRLHIVLGQVPPLDDLTELAYIGEACSIAAVLDDLRCLLIVRATLQPGIPLLAAVHGSEQVGGMVRDGVLHTRILSEIRRDGHIGAVRILFPCLLGVDALAVPGRSCPGVPGKRLLHSKTVICILGKLTLSITGFQNKLRCRYGSKNPGLLLISSEQRADLLNDICFRQVLQFLRLQAGHFFFFDFFFFVFLGRHLFFGPRNRLSDSAV